MQNFDRVQFIKPEFKIGEKVYLKYAYMVAIENKTIPIHKIPKFIKWLLSTCPFDGECVGEIISYNLTTKPLVRFNKPIFKNHPNKRDREGFEAYLIDKVITNKPHSLITINH